ncbi:PspC domain-containing protein [Mesobacillus zeae]|uniref:PspC domain-containing protein n=1 Tax=Mesobacillus zeae TaxID=1917180 RepID=A0A398BB73_9BACI|nr:PspC domain-containing protein [Mesobacillus zeae]RID84946.1 PspC domain-containing protein [Mesobacillus zeae]
MKIVRSRTNRKIAGIIGGIAQTTGIDATILRIIFIILLITTAFFPLAITYLLLTFIIPKEER